MKHNSLFAEAFSKLNQQQRLAVETTEGPVMVIAGPGTGKTQILTLRIAHILVQTQSNPDNILALTFTENAAREMKERLSKLIGSDAYKVHIQTFHAFCNELIQKNFDIFHHLASYEPITELEEIEIISAIIETGLYKTLRPQGDPEHYYHSIRSSIGSLKKEGIAPTTLMKAVQSWKSDFEKRDDLYHIKGRYKGKMKGSAFDEQRHIAQTEEFAHVYESYQLQIEERKMYDFDDMIIEVVRGLQTNEALLASVRETFQYILIDEHQDTNNAQNAVIELICGIDDFPNLFVVGDEKQSIFRFQGASLENFLYFQKLYPRAKLIHLEENYRSTQRILDATHAFIRHNPKSISSETALQAKKMNHAFQLHLAEYADPNQEADGIVTKIKENHSKNISYKDMAILVKKNEDVYRFARILEREDIPYLVSSPDPIFDDLQIRKIVMLLRGIAHVGTDIEFSRLFLMDIFETNPLDVFTVTQRASRARKTVWEVIQNETVPESVRTAGQKLIDWKKRSQNTPIDIFFLDVIHESGIFRQMLAHPNSFAQLQKLSLLYEDIKQVQRRNHAALLDEYIVHIDLLERHAISFQAPPADLHADRVFISTVHKSKGLEFDVVFVPNLVDGYWGGGRSRSTLLRIPWRYISRSGIVSEEVLEIEEERRLFYVALTRAKQFVNLSFARHDSAGKAHIPSQFMSEIPDEHIQREVIVETQHDAAERLARTLVPSSQSRPQFSKSEFQAYITSRFSEQGVSVSALNNFISCPWKYIFRNLVRLPDVRGFYLLLGTAVHESIREYIISLKQNKALTSLQLQEYFLTTIDTFSASQNDIELLKTKGGAILQSYYQKRMSTWDTRRETEIIIPNIRMEEGIFINGKIDMIELNADKTVTVFDFKTGKVKSRNDMLGLTKKADKSYFRQLVFYRLLLTLFQRGKYNMKKGVIEFVESAIDGDIRSELFEITAEDTDVVKEEIRTMKENMYNLTFWDKRCEDKGCEYCSYSSYLGNVFK